LNGPQKKTAYDYTVDGFCMKKGFSSNDHATWSNKQLFIVSLLATKLSTQIEHRGISFQLDLQQE